MIWLLVMCEKLRYTCIDMMNYLTVLALKGIYTLAHQQGLSTYIFKQDAWITVAKFANLPSRGFNILFG